MTQENPQNMNDHDLLVILHEQVKGIREDIANIQNTNSKSIEDHELRLRSLEQRIWLWTGAAGVIGAAASLAVKFFSH